MALVAFAGAASAAQPRSAMPSDRLKLYGTVDVFGSSCAAAGVTLVGKTFPLTVEKVRLGSSASFSGIARNDKVLSAKVEGTKLRLTIERNGRTYVADLRTSAARSAGEIAAAEAAAAADEKAAAAYNTAVNDSLLKGGARGNPRVYVRMGLCGSWDEEGEGRRRFLVLASEMTPPHMPARTPLAEAWNEWKQTIGERVIAQLPRLGPLTESASTHISLTSSGIIRDISFYSGDEVPYRKETPSKDTTAKLVSLLRGIQMPPFPAESQAVEAHVLIYVTTNTNCEDGDRYCVRIAPAKPNF